MKSSHKYGELIVNHESLMNRLDEYASKWFIFKNSKLTIWEAFQIKGWFEFLINKNIESAKQAFFDCSKIDIYYYQLFDKNVSDLFSYGRTHVLQTALSDNKFLMNEYSQINYQLHKHGRKLVWYSDMVASGEMHIYCDLINNAMNQNLKELSNLIEIVKAKSLKKKKNEWIGLDLKFFQGLIDKDKDKVYDVVNTLCTTEHKRRNKHSWIYKDLVSQPAQGYAKIAWLNNLEIEIDNDLIHNELLPINPNPKYRDNAKELISKMTLESKIKHFNGHRLKKEEYDKLYN